MDTGQSITSNDNPKSQWCNRLSGFKLIWIIKTIIANNPTLIGYICNIMPPSLQASDFSGM